MGFDKIILKAVLSTLAAMVILCGALLLSLTFIFPSTMMEISYKLGMDNASVRYATRAYQQSGEEEIYYIAFATEVSIGVKDSKKIEECAQQLVQNENFATYCQEIDQRNGANNEYVHYVYGQLCMAKYNNGKELEAIELAFNSFENGFPANNAVGAVLVAAIHASDTQSVCKISEKLDQINIDEQALSQAETAYLQQIRLVIQQWTD